ncbi:MAG: hypothetical protein KatS3mg105_1493 [Gemmatales bacterium]|nr:MAG: hypothetical protein KatS3mg105_1493 [Gemmatales bacterium]
MNRLLTVALVAWFVPVLTAQEAARVVTMRVRKMKAASSQSFVGTIMPVRVSTVGSAVDGRVAEFLVNEGDYVRAGQPIAKLRQQLIEADVAAARADLDLRQVELKELVSSLPVEIEQAKARLALAEAALRFAKAKRQRNQTLVGRGVSREDLEESASLAEQAQANLEEAKAALKILQGPRQQRIAQAKARVASQQALLDRLEEQLERHTIRAPFDGYITAEFTEVGQWLKPGDPVVEIAELAEVDVQVGVLEDYVGFLREGQTVRVDVGALPDRTFTGTIQLIVPKGDLRSRTFPVKIRLKNKKLGKKNVLLKAGMFARVTLPVGELDKEAYFVPKDALVLGGSRHLVFVVKQGIARRVPVELGLAHEDWIEVKGELSDNDVVVVQGNERLRPGQKVDAVFQD